MASDEHAPSLTYSETSTDGKMSTRTIYLISYRPAPRTRAHFAIWVPYQEGGSEGTSIHVIDAPMLGYKLEFKRKYNPVMDLESKEVFAVGQINAQYVHDWTGPYQLDATPISNLEQVAAQLPPPRISKNFLGPVDDIINRRCQEWTTDFIRRLVEIKYVHISVLDNVQMKRDPPDFGVGLQGAQGRGAGQPAQAQQ